MKERRTERRKGRREGQKEGGGSIKVKVIKCSRRESWVIGLMSQIRE